MIIIRADRLTRLLLSVELCWLLVGDLWLITIDAAALKELRRPTQATVNELSASMLRQDCGKVVGG